MNRSWIFVVIVFIVLFVVLAYQGFLVRQSINRGYVQERKVIDIMNDMRMFKQEVKFRDSILLIGIENGYRKIEEMSNIRKMTQREIDSLKLVIDGEIDAISGFKKGMLSW